MCMKIREPLVDGFYYFMKTTKCLPNRPATDKILSPDFFARDTVTVAKDLLGHYLVRQDVTAGVEVICRIVETEAYTQDDPACHAYGKTSGRAATLYKQPGLAYVYLIYGMYHCLNVITEPEGKAGAVLFRALEPIYTNTEGDYKTHGPGRLCKALGITKAEHNEILLTDPTQPLYLCEGKPVKASDIVTTTRIGISSAQDYLWRFYIDQNPWVSVKAQIT
jgi:DNA-3-methyladenine glycosylase